MQRNPSLIATPKKKRGDIDGMTLRRCIQLLGPVCFIAWWVIGAAGVWLREDPTLAPRLAEFLRTNTDAVFLVWLGLLPLALYLKAPAAYREMLREQRQEFDNTPLTRLTGRTAASLFAEIAVLAVVVLVCTAVMLLALLDILRNAPGNLIMSSIGVVAFWIWWSALRRLRRFIYPM